LLRPSRFLSFSPPLRFTLFGSRCGPAEIFSLVGAILSHAASIVPISLIVVAALTQTCWKVASVHFFSPFSRACFGRPLKCSAAISGWFFHNFPLLFLSFCFPPLTWCFLPPLTYVVVFSSNYFPFMHAVRTPPCFSLFWTPPVGWFVPHAGAPREVARYSPCISTPFLVPSTDP